MPILFACHECGQTYARPNEDAGKKGRCAKCGASLIVPPSTREPAADPIDVSPLPTPFSASPLEGDPPPPLEPLDESPPATDQVCPACAETIKAAAKKCRYCGELLDRRLRREAERKAGPSAGIAALLSLLIPGAGSMYAGKIGQGSIVFGTVFGCQD